MCVHMYMFNTFLIWFIFLSNMYTGASGPSESQYFHEKGGDSGVEQQSSSSSSDKEKKKGTTNTAASLEPDSDW